MSARPETSPSEPPRRATVGRRLLGWLGTGRPGLIVMALIVGAGAGLGAVVFRWLIFSVTWLVTGHDQFGQQGHAASAHFPGLGIWFIVLAPVLGGLIYGPLVQRFAREARGHGVPEVMLAVAENGGRIRPPVTIVKALASALTIGTGGSVGREGPIVQIGSALASTLGQLVRMSEARMRVIVACGAAGGIAATFNAPITGLFFGFEIVLREFSLDALFATSLAAVTGDLISRAVFGSAPFFSSLPHDLAITNDTTYLLVAVLALVAGLLGLGFKTVLYRMEDRVDELWSGHPEWARPAVGGVALGLLLLALPQMYGVGYPVMDNVIAGHVVLGLILLFAVAKIVATSLTLSIGGSGGVFAPSLFIGAMAGMAFGTGVHDAFGPAVGPPAMYAVLAMGGVFAGAAQAPLTAIASVVEMTGNFGLTLPVMLASGIAAAVSKHFSYGSVYTTKLLRRGIDIERPRAANLLNALTVADVMQPVSRRLAAVPPTEGNGTASHVRPAEWKRLIGPIATIHEPQELFPDETLDQALRQLILYGRSGLPVISPDREHLQGWVTRRDVLDALASSLADAARDAARGAEAAEFGSRDPEAAARRPRHRLDGYEIVEITVDENSPVLGRRLDEIEWPPGTALVALTQNREIVPWDDHDEIAPGETLILLAPTAPEAVPEPASAVVSG